jgi:hypothetical protein
MTAKWTDFVSGAVLTAAQLNDVLDNFQDIAIFNEQQASNTNGGTFTSGSYLKRTLNTTVVNNITGCSIASSVITLPAGTYNIVGTAPAYNTKAHRLRLRNTTASTTIALGVNAFSASGGFATTYAYVNGTVTLTVSTTIELQHQAETTATTNGFGTLCNFGDNEVYAQIQITRIG